MSIEAMKLAAEFNRYFTSANGVDVPAKVSVSRDEWRALLTAIQQAEAQRPDSGELVYQICKKDSHCISSAWIDVEKRAYEDAGMYPEYGRRTLYTRPAPSVFLVRDVASLLGASVPDVCSALAELGYEPRRSTNAAISPDEATAVAKRLNPAPSVPADVVRDAERYRWLMSWLQQMNLLKAEFGQMGKGEKPSDWWMLNAPYGIDKTRPFFGHGKTADAAIDAAMLAAK